MFNYPCSIFEAYPVEIFPNPMIDGELGQRAALLRQIASLETLERADKEYLYWHELPIYIEPMRPAKYYQTVDFYLNDAGIHAPQAAITLSFHQVGESNPHAYAKPSSPFIGKGYMTYVLNGRVLDEELIMKEKVAPGKICSGFTLGEHDRVIIPLDPAWLRQGMNRLEFEIRHRPRDCDYYVYIYQLSLQIRHH